jgi:hypothetical protein
MRSTRAAAFFTAMAFVSSLAAAGSAKAPAKSRLTGAWTLNKELSDQPPDRGERGDESGRGRRTGGGGFGGGGRGGGMRRGGGGGGMGRGGGDGRAGMDRDEMARRREAMRDILEAADRLTITEAESMVVITSDDGRTTRLSTDGKKIKDDSTKIERKTKWEGSRLISEISGAGRGKITQTYTVDAGSRQLRIAVQMDGGRDGQMRTVTHVYDRDERPARP